MSVAGGPDIVEQGLVLCLDAVNNKSYSGSGTSWRDLAGNGYNGTLTNGPTFSNEAGGIIIFDGVNDHITLGDVSDLNFTNGRFSVESWVYIPSTWTSGFQFPNLISKGANAGWDTNGWSMFIFRNWNGPYAWGCGIRNGVNSLDRNIVYRSSAPSDRWLHLVITTDNSTIRLYENAVLQATGAQTYNPGSTTTPVYIGSDDATSYFNGKVGSCKLYNRTLSEAEILQNFNATRSRFGV